MADATVQDRLAFIFMNQKQRRPKTLMHADEKTFLAWMLENKIEIIRSLETPCWEWIREVNWKGYGRVAYKNRRWQVHRLMWILNNGGIPDSTLVLHRCDNPCCFNLDHLFLGTDLINRNDALQKGRRKWCYSRKLTIEQVRWIKSIRPNPGRPKQGELSSSQIARMLNVSNGCIEKVLSGESWKGMVP